MDYSKDQDYINILDSVKSNLSGVAWPTIIIFFISAFVIITLQILYAKNQIHIIPHLVITSYFMYVMTN